MKRVITDKLIDNFYKRFGSSPQLFRSPGRVNIIGEHTDYNNGFVLPAAIDKSVYVGISKRPDNLIRLNSVEYDGFYETIIEHVKPVGGWPDYILGVVDQFKKRGTSPGGFDMIIEGEIPVGAGLSSSAAVECATAFAIDQIFDLGYSRKDLVFIGQKAEHDFAKVNCGIMDQFASIFGKKDHVIKLDCQNLDYEYIPLELEGYKIVLLNSNVKHSLASSEYNTRRSQCEEGVSLVRKKYEHVNSLREVSAEMLIEMVKPIDPIVFKRCLYVVKENERLQLACEALKKGKLDELGKRMFESHDGLSREYEVSCRELDFLVDSVRNERSVIGARMMGGGFGGCTINLVKEDSIADLVKELSIEYEQAMALPLTAYIAETANGAGPVE